MLKHTTKKISSDLGPAKKKAKLSPHVGGQALLNAGFKKVCKRNKARHRGNQEKHRLLRACDISTVMSQVTNKPVDKFGDRKKTVDQHLSGGKHGVKSDNKKHNARSVKRPKVPPKSNADKRYGSAGLLECASKQKLSQRKRFKRKRRKPNIAAGGDASKPSSVASFKKTNFPNTPEEISSNWKEFLKTDPLVRRKSKTKEPSQTESTKHIVKQSQNAKLVEKTEPEIWFDDVDEILIEGLKKTQVEAPAATNNSTQDPVLEKSEPNKRNPLVKPKSFVGLTKVVAMDCEMVGVGEEGKDSVLARVSMVNQFGQCIYDKYVKPTEEVTDYRTFVSGIRPENVAEGEEFSIVQKEVADIIKGRVLVGHAVMNDLKVLYLSHPKKKLRDTSRFRPFRQLSGGKTPGLKRLCQEVLGVKVQEGEHSSVQDAQGAMRLYTIKRKEWEKSIREKASLAGKKAVSVKVKGKVTRIPPGN